ncbi:hypothetical protein D3C80_1231350 [compost metagenome]
MQFIVPETKITCGVVNFSFAVKSVRVETVTGVALPPPVAEAPNPSGELMK